MKLIFYMPQHWVNTCFTENDVKLLSEHCDVVRLDPSQAPDAWQSHAPTADALITGWDTPPLTDDMLDQAPNIRLLLHAAGSVRHLLPTTFWDRGIRLTSAREALATGVAETTIGMIIAGLKGFFPADRLTSEGGWKTSADQMPSFRVRETYGSTVGVIGASKVGRHVMNLLRHLETRTLIYDPYIDDREAQEYNAQKVGLEELMSASDVVTLHAPELPETQHMLKAEHFQLMKDDAIFINTARGSIIDESALAKELQRRRIWAFIDVTEPEPPAPDHLFRTLPNVVLTPHIAGAMSNGCLRIGRSITQQLLDFIRGEKLHGEITKDEAARLA